MQTPHSYRRSAIHAVIIFIILMIIIVAASGCAPKYGCPAVHKNKLQGYGWLKNRKTNRIFILNMDGSIKCSYYDIATDE